MKVTHIPCGAFANESEARAFREVKGALLSAPEPGNAFILTNLTFPNQRGQADEIDMVVIAPGGAAVVEVKHWDASSLRHNQDIDHHAELITAKAKRIAGRLRAIDPKLDFVPGCFLFTRESSPPRRAGKQIERLGVPIYSLKEVGHLVKDLAYGNLTSTERLARSLAPRQVDVGSAVPRRFARFDELRPLSPVEDRFARVFAARDPASGDHVILHAYDLSAVPSAEKADVSERRAKREFDVVQRFQKSPHLPSLVDSWQPLPNYSGEMFFFTLAESAAVSVEALMIQASWSIGDRIGFAGRALRALAELQEPVEIGGQPLIHRALNPANIRVKANGAPLFAGWRWARLPNNLTIASAAAMIDVDPYAAPEVQKAGLPAATPASDVWSLCKVLSELLDTGGTEVEEARSILSRGLAADPARRALAIDIANAIDIPIAASVFQAPAAPAPTPPSRWDEGHEFEWNGKRYRVVAALGQGGFGRTFKLDEFDGRSHDPVGSFVGKVVFNPEMGERSLLAYKKIRSLAHHDGLSGVLETSSTWSADSLMALLRWTRGEPIDAWRGEVQFLAEVAGETGECALVLRWFEELCSALNMLHVQGWVHGDVSPSNILADEGRVTLIDYDLAGPIGRPVGSPGTAPYSPPERLAGAPPEASDDVFALAASLFHVLTGRSPTGAGQDGLPWTAAEREKCKLLVELLDAATRRDRAQRFETAGAALRWLRAETSKDVDSSPTTILPADHAIDPLRPNVVPRVKEILCTYPGSRFGNAETRGLDTTFAEDTYVETGLDEILLKAVREGTVSLVILCGNAGDGKTAFLQHLAVQLGTGPLPSKNRVWEGELGGHTVKINLDGAASWNGRSADILLDDLFAPFQKGRPKDGRVHLVAVNDGRLLEWIDHSEAISGGERTALTQQLGSSLAGDEIELAPHIKLVELNQRSLVGGVDTAKNRVTSEFIDRLTDRLVGGDEAADIWRPCETCTAKDRCPMRRSALMMGASQDPAILGEGRLLRERLTAALQAVHQRNEVHITARELKAALSYILFGLYACEDLHENPGLVLHHPAEYAFNPDSEKRQGELLRELARLDPGLEAQAKVDRYLRGSGAPDAAHGARRFHNADRQPLPLRQARRQAYFGWTDAQIAAVGGDKNALMLKDGRHFANFRDFPLLPAEKQVAIKQLLCEGLSRLESLPDAAFRTVDIVPVRIVPRTPTETAFWVGKPLDKFGLEPERFAAPQGLETLHRFLTLSYQPSTGPTERLNISLELFALLMDVADGVQIMDAFSDDVFANLGVFTQRLAQEDERSLRAWNPADDSAVFTIGIERRGTEQTIVMARGS